MHQQPAAEGLSDHCAEQRQLLATELEHEVSEILLSTLLWLQHAKLVGSPLGHPSILAAEDNLRVAIHRISRLYKSLS